MAGVGGSGRTDGPVGRLRRVLQLADVHRDKDYLDGPMSWRFFGARVARQPMNTNAATTGAKIANCRSSAMLFLRSLLSAAVRACDRSPPACWVATAAPARHVDLRDCNAGRASPHRTNRRPPDRYRPSMADRRDPHTPSPCHRKGRTPLH